MEQKLYERFDKILNKKGYGYNNSKTLKNKYVGYVYKLDDYKSFGKDIRDYRECLKYRTELPLILQEDELEEYANIKVKAYEVAKQLGLLKK